MHTTIIRRRKLRKLIPAILVPVACVCMAKAVPIVSAAAERLSEIKINTPQEAELPLFFSSEGFGIAAETTAPNTQESSTVTETTASTAAQTASASADNPVPYPTEWSPGTGKIVRLTMQDSQGTQFFKLDQAGSVRNCTSHSNEELLEESRKAPAFSIRTDGSPQVLIMHTHTTESFEPFVRERYDPSFGYRTTDPAHSVIAVGDAVERELKAAGIGVIHDTMIHDYPSYNGSYGRSGTRVEEILAEHPSICVVLDIHRDALTRGEDILQPYVEIDGKEAAQVMIISGCDDGTLNMPDYMKNFRFASLLQQQIASDYPGLTRPVLFDYRKYNQDLTTGSLLLEIGAHGNTLDQAVYSGTLVGKSIAAALLRCAE
ncbi:MAG: stage II sporulation protein P [Ruminococcus sp.]|nr:stage II sporulation protein P [Ruminococcus sp.]